MSTTPPDRSESNGMHDLKRKLDLKQHREEDMKLFATITWTSEQLNAIWDMLRSRASANLVKIMIGIGLALTSVFGGGLVYVSQVDKQVTRNTTKIETIEKTLDRHTEVLEKIYKEVSK